MVWIILGVVLVIIIGWYIGTANKMRTHIVKCEEALSDIDVALTKRFDTLTKMLETTKGYAKHESETLMNVIAMRKGVKDMTPEEKVEYDKTLNEATRSLNVVVEQYPDLKANELFKGLQNAIVDIEDHLAASRRVYNSNVSSLKQMTVVFPSSIVAKMAHIVVPPMFAAEERKREDVNMTF